ncbi:MAG: sialidase family protein [Gemmatimonadales bacterium]
MSARGLPTRSALAAAAILITGCELAAPELETRTLALPSPEGVEPVFEPHLSLDPSDPDRILVAAHYGVGYNRGGKSIWTWHSGDGGRTWEGARMPLPNEAAALAADAVTGFDERGRGYVSFLYADTTGRRFDGGAALAVTTEGSRSLGPARTFVGGGLERGGAIDKDWIALDRHPTSPFRGSLYLSWHRNIPDFATGTVASSFWVTASRDGGATFESERRVADAFSGQLAVRRDGTVDAIFAPAGEAVLLHAASTDGARTFSAPDTIATLIPAAGPRPTTPLDVPALLAHGDSLLVCWSASRAADSTRFAIRCAISPDGARWDAPNDVVPDLPRSESLGFPALASGAGATWLLGYHGDSTGTRVVLFRSKDGGRHWSEFRELARRGLGVDRFCLAAGAACRRAEPGTVFFPGDYFGLDAGTERVAAAFVLPAEERPDALPTVYVSLVRP